MFFVNWILSNSFDTWDFEIIIVDMSWTFVPFRSSGSTGLGQESEKQRLCATRYELLWNNDLLEDDCRDINVDVEKDTRVPNLRFKMRMKTLSSISAS